MSWTVRCLAAFAVVAAVTGCAPRIGAGPSQVPPAPTPIDSVTLAADRRSVRVDFVGGRAFDPADPCSVAYRGTAAIVGDVLEIGVYAEPHPKPLPSGWACDAVGYRRTLVLQLPGAFDGSRVRDLSGRDLPLG